ncbi:uncharacterized protein Triagg1_2332 [Trichoderma aggressivum f. europaeum]|uniref:Peptidase S8/S53 domain-containing protein n=1 Tax=Trichoderma aggressivum f. europaeum TaxID=173218 RepID=A0AAE1IJZ8_9HYPO|nr:hypothetical protein Triagg1_2332 [Trichoderma aggressivum f. europaeum]
MSLVNASQSEIQPPPLLKMISKDGHRGIGPYWEALISDWEADRTYDIIREGIERYEKRAPETAAEESKAAVFSQLRDILTFESETIRTQTQRIQLLYEVTRDFVKNDSKAKKSLPTVKRLEHAGLIIKAICYRHPKIAFEPSLDGNGNFYHPSAFQFAVTSKSDYMLQIVLDELMDSFENDISANSKINPQGPQSQDVNCESKMAAENDMRDFLELLLNTSTSLQPDVVARVMDILKMMVSKNSSLIDEKTWEIAVTTPAPDFVRLLLESKDSKFLTKAHAAFVIEKGTAGMWNMFPEKSRREFISDPDCSFLHKAVSLGKVDMVEALLELEPTLIEITVQEAGYEYPIQHLKKLGETPNADGKGEEYNAIRDLLVHAMIRSQNFGLQKIRETLKNSNVEAKEMSVQFPQFKSDAKNQSCTDYVQVLKGMDAEFFQYEKLLKYVSFPDLSGQAPFMGIEDLKQDHREVKDVFDWLKKRGVEEVMSLTVEDHLHCPHRDEDVAKCVNNFRVGVLKWKKRDIYLTNLRKDAIEELHLWSSGNQSVHDQWLGQIPKFKQDVLSPRRISEVSKQLEEDLNKLQGEPGYPWIAYEEEASVDRDGDFKTQPQTKPRIKVSQIQWLQQRENIIYRSLDNISSDLVGPQLAEFVKKFSRYYMENQETKKTKVALIDSGVVVVGGVRDDHHHEGKEEAEGKGEKERKKGKSSGSVLAQRIVEGISLVGRDNEEQPWWHATEPHGTQMATLICSINPFCDLYVVKVAESNASGVTGPNVAKAIDWARGKGVDVISLSLVAFSDPGNVMARAIKSAIADDIVITCSTADEGSVATRSVSDKSGDVLSIAACDKWGNLLPQSQKTGFNYQFIGHNVHVGQVPYLESAESIEGSSVSTAVAAGMASLILACARISSEFSDTDLGSSRRPTWRCAIVKKIFDRMAGQGTWAVLERLCGEGQLEKEYDFKKLVNESFTDLLLLGGK